MYATKTIIPPVIGPMKCKDCGDPATERADENTVSSIWGVLVSPSVPVCPPCKLRREKGKK